MEIQALKLLVTEKDLSDLAARLAEQNSNEQMSELQVRITPEAVVIGGVYQMLMRVPFETFWIPSIRNGQLAVTLANLKVVKIGAGLLKGVLLRILADETANEDAVKIEGDTVLLDIERLLAKQGITLRANLTSVHCGEGSLVLEAGTT
jgi:hypothetical protein